MNGARGWFQDRRCYRRWPLGLRLMKLHRIPETELRHLAENGIIQSSAFVLGRLFVQYYQLGGPRNDLSWQSILATSSKGLCVFRRKTLRMVPRQNKIAPFPCSCKSGKAFLRTKDIPSSTSRSVRLSLTAVTCAT